MKKDGAIINFFPAQIGGYKEVKLLNQIKGFYQNKEYKSALNAIDKILKTQKDNGELQSLKGLILSQMGRNSEAYNCAHVGIKKNDKSIFCWINLGLLCQADFDYENAIECFQNALKISPLNVELLHFISPLQAQMRNLSAFVECRGRILMLEPNDKFNHIASAISHHLEDNCLKAVEILENYEKSLVGGYSSEHEEMLLYKISLLEESGNFEKALEKLEEEKLIVENVAFKEQKVSLLVKLNLLDEAKKIYKELLSQNPENYSYHAGLQKCVASSDHGHEIQEFKDLYKSLGEQHTSSSAVKRIPLDFLQGDEFRIALDIYIRTLLHERVPSLFSDLWPLYELHDKAYIIDQVIIELENSIRIENEPVQNLLWTLCLSAQHYDRRGQYEIALAKVDEAIQQNPAVAELYLVKGRILKHGGDLEAAASLAKKVWDMDPKNSFTKKKYVKRMLQVDKDVEFKKDGGDHKDPWSDTECMWYELASGDSYFRRDDLGRSLKHYLAVLKYYTEMIKDHFDFHYYHSRKMTLRACVGKLKYQERLDPGSYFRKAAAGVVRCYIRLYDSSTKLDDETSRYKMHLMMLASQKKTQETTASIVTNSEKLQGTKSRKKQEKKKWNAKELGGKNEDESIASRASKFGGQQHSKPVDSDLISSKLLQVEDPLLEAMKYLKLLRKSFPNFSETYFLLFELSMRKQEIEHAYEALNELVRLERDNPDTLRCSIRFYSTLDSMVLEERVRNALATPLSTLREDYMTKKIKDFLLLHNESLMHQAAGAEMLFFLQPYKKSSIIELLEVTRELGPDIKRQWRLKDCIIVHKLLKSVLGDAIAASRWELQCRLLFPFSSYFSAINVEDTSVNTREREVWILDSGSAIHCTGDASVLSRKYSSPGTILAANGNLVSYSEVGHACIQCGSRRFYLYDVRYIPHLKNVINIVSVKGFTLEHGHLVQFFHDGFLIRNENYIKLVPSEFILARGRTANERYLFISKLPGEEEERSKWNLDSGSCHHSTSDQSLLDYTEDGEEVSFRYADDTTGSFSKKGSCKLTYTSENGVTRTFNVNDVYLTPRGPHLLSVLAFTRDNNCSLLFTPDHYYILDATDDRLLKPDLVLGYGTVNAALNYVFC